MNRNHTNLIDALLIVVVVLLGIAVFASLLSPVLPPWVLYLSLGGLAVVAMALAVTRWITRPDRLRAQQSHRILEIADASLAHLRRGLSEETAQRVCQIVLDRTDAAAIAITDTTAILGFAGIGEEHHLVGSPVLTEATREALARDEMRVLRTREEINCPRRDCLLRAGIVVPLHLRRRPAGSLKFYYTSPRLLNETQLAMAEGLAQLLSTQLELSELDLQTALACRMELKALQAQINPHFLFNTINTIASLIRTDPPRARDLLREFAAFYRRTLEMSDDLITLEQEIGYVRSYFLFEEARFGNAVQLSVDVPPSHLDLLLPAFVLQPLVENSIQHGKRADAPLHVSLTCDFRGDFAMLSVTDDGAGIPEGDLDRILEPGFGKGNGIALKNVHERLRGHFGPGSGVSATSVLGTGTTVTLVIARPPETVEQPVQDVRLVLERRA
ncbi:MAG TPA: histidine kinase [Thermoleophilia bacterium]|nr:histidine kinase [Thermoleophilia bacterium]